MLTHVANTVKFHKIQRKYIHGLLIVRFDMQGKQLTLLHYACHIWASRYQGVSARHVARGV